MPSQSLLHLSQLKLWRTKTKLKHCLNSKLLSVHTAELMTTLDVSEEDTSRLGDMQKATLSSIRSTILTLKSKVSAKTQETFKSLRKTPSDLRTLRKSNQTTQLHWEQLCKMDLLLLPSELEAECSEIMPMEFSNPRAAPQPSLIMSTTMVSLWLGMDKPFWDSHISSSKIHLANHGATKVMLWSALPTTERSEELVESSITFTSLSSQLKMWTASTTFNNLCSDLEF